MVEILVAGFKSRSNIAVLGMFVALASSTSLASSTISGLTGEVW